MRKNSMEKRQMLGPHCKMMECLKSNQLNANGFECRGWKFDAFVSTFDAFDVFDALCHHRLLVALGSVDWWVDGKSVKIIKRVKT